MSAKKGGDAKPIGQYTYTQEKAKPVVRQGRKNTDLNKDSRVALK
jgi:hypothetical protein